MPRSDWAKVTPETIFNGETHSLLMLPLWALLLSWTFARIFKSPGGWRDFYGLTAVTLLVHIFGDWITGYGTQIVRACYGKPTPWARPSYSTRCSRWSSCWVS